MNRCEVWAALTGLDRVGGRGYPARCAGLACFAPLGRNTKAACGWFSSRHCASARYLSELPINFSPPPASRARGAVLAGFRSNWRSCLSPRHCAFAFLREYFLWGIVGASYDSSESNGKMEPRGALNWQLHLKRVMVLLRGTGRETKVLPFARVC
jgi:hypothetical protein